MNNSICSFCDPSLCFCRKNAENLTKSIDDIIETVHSTVIFPILFCIGVSGNILNLVVLNDRNIRSKATLFLSSVSFADLIFFLAMFPYNLYRIMKHNLIYSKLLFGIRGIGLAFANWMSASSIWLTIGMSVERLLAVRYPLQTNSFLRFRYLLATVVSIYTCTFILNIYLFLHHQVFEMRPVCQVFNSSYCGILEDEFVFIFAKANRLSDSYFLHSYMISIFIVVFIPLILLCFFGVALVCTMRLSLLEFDQRYSVESSNCPSGRRNSKLIERRITRTVSFIIAAFVICCLPSGLLYTVDYLSRFELANNWPLFTLLIQLSNILVEFSKALNFFLYVTTCQQFRMKLKQLLTREQYLHKILTNNDLLSSKINRSIRAPTPTASMARVSKCDVNLEEFLKKRRVSYLENGNIPTNSVHTSLLDEQC